MNGGAWAALDGVGPRRLEPVVRRAVGCAGARVGAWAWQPLDYQSFLADRTLVRFSGSALGVAGHAEPVAWSSVLKLMHQPAIDPSGPVTSTGREVLAYRSSLLERLPGPLRAPRLYAIDDDPDGTVWLWLEDVHDIYDHHWPLEQFGLAARHLGQFNGAFLLATDRPHYPWFIDWLERHWINHQAELAQTPDVWGDLERLARQPAVRRACGADIGPRLARLIDDQAALVAGLARLPATLCHHESSLANLFAVHGPAGQLVTVAVDWEQVGYGCLGADISTLVFGSMRRCEIDARRAVELERAVFDGYVDGLRLAGWQGPLAAVRFGYCAALALRWGVLRQTLRMLVEGARPLRTSQGWLVPGEQVVQQWVRLGAFTLERADEARRLMADVTLH